MHPTTDRHAYVADVRIHFFRKSTLLSARHILIGLARTYDMLNSLLRGVSFYKILGDSGEFVRDLESGSLGS